MILRGLKNFGKSIKYYFTPLGILCIFSAIAFSVSISGISRSVQELFTSLGQTIGQSSINWGEAGNSIWNSIISLNWDITQLLNVDWIIATLTAALNATGLGETVAAAADAISLCAGKIITYVIVFFVLIIVGIVLGYVVLFIQVRGYIIKDKWWKVGLYALVDSILGVLLTSGLFALVKLWFPLIFVVPLLALILVEMLSTSEAYLIHGFKKVKFREVFSVKVIALLALTDVIIFLSGISLVVLVVLIFKSLVGIIIGLPLLELTLIVSRLTAESYVVDKMNGTYDKEREESLKRKEAHKAKRLEKKANAS